MGFNYIHTHIRTYAHPRIRTYIRAHVTYNTTPFQQRQFPSSVLPSSPTAGLRKEVMIQLTAIVGRDWIHLASSMAVCVQGCPGPGLGPGSGRGQ